MSTSVPLTDTTTEQVPRIEGKAIPTVAPPEVGRLRLDIAPSAADGRDALYRVTVHNETDAPARISLLPSEPEDGLRFAVIGEEPLAIPAGEERSVALKVAPTDTQTIGEPRLYQFTVRGLPEGIAPSTAVDPALTGHAAFTYVPRLRAAIVPAPVRRLPRWALRLLPLLLLALVFSAGLGTAGVMGGFGAAPPAAPPRGTGVPSMTPISTHVRPVIAAPPPHIVRFAAQARPGGTVMAAWATSGASQVRLNGKPVAPSGEVALPAGAASTLVLSAANAAGTTTRTLVVAHAAATMPAVARLPDIKLFTLWRDSATGKTELRWQVAGAERVELDGQTVASPGRRPLAHAGPATYRLVATNRFGSVTSSLVVFEAKAPAPRPTPVPQAPVISRFTLERTGGVFTLVWETQHATAVTLNGKTVAAGGKLALGTPKQGSTFDLVARNNAGSSKGQVTVTLTGGASPGGRAIPLRMPRIVAFRVQSINGQLVASWQVVEARQVTLNGKAVPAAASRTVPPGVRSLTLIAANDVGLRRQQITVPIAAPTAMFTPTHTVAPVPTATSTPRATVPPSPTSTPATPRASATRAPTSRPSATSTPVLHRNVINTPTATPPRATATLVPTVTAVPTAAHTPTSVPTRIVAVPPTPTRTFPPTPSPTRTITARRVARWTATPTVTAARLPARPTFTRTPTAVATATRTATSRPTNTSTSTATWPPIPQIATSTTTWTATAIPTHTFTPTPTSTPIATFTGTATTIPTHTFTPTTTGTPTPTLTFTPTPTSTNTPTPTSTPLPSWSVSPLGTVTIPAYTGVIFTVANVGPGPLTSLAFATDSTAFAVSRRGIGVCTQGQTLAPGDSCRIPVGFAPINGGGTSATLTVSANGLPPSYQISLTGQLATISIAPTPPDPTCSGGANGVCVQAGYPRVFTITNTSASAYAGGIVPNVTPTGGRGTFAITQNNCGASPLAPGAQCTVTVAYTAAYYPNCDRAGTLTIDADLRPSVLAVPLWGWSYCIG